mmetsp:Transcript_5039/g.11093  ORF Transcript_5039/g.11093 Transcript_5039/m.11093 type:complete len:256 (-) Transcript_5039:935-1702(-)
MLNFVPSRHHDPCCSRCFFARVQYCCCVPSRSFEGRARPRSFACCPKERCRRSQWNFASVAPIASFRNSCSSGSSDEDSDPQRPGRILGKDSCRCSWLPRSYYTRLMPADSMELIRRWMFFYHCTPSLIPSPVRSQSSLAAVVCSCRNHRISPLLGRRSKRHLPHRPRNHRIPRICNCCTHHRYCSPGPCHAAQDGGPPPNSPPSRVPNPDLTHDPNPDPNRVPNPAWDFFPTRPSSLSASPPDPLYQIRPRCSS